MKLIQLFILFAFFATTNIYSQKIGFHVGATSATMLDRTEFRNDDEHYQRVYGLDVGIDAKIEIVKNLSVLSGLSFYQTGFFERARRTGNSGRIEKTIELDYLKLPINLLLETNGKAYAAVRSGPYFSYLLGGDFEERRWYEDVEVNDAYKNFDWGISFGGIVGYSRFALDVGYDLGMENISKGQTLLISSVSKNRSWNFKLIYYPF